MKLLAMTTALALLLAGALAAAEPVSRTYAAPVDRVWSVTESVLKVQGWDIDRADRSIGTIVTESRRVEGEDYGVYAKGTRHRLQVEVRPAGDGKTTVTVQRTLFKRERILFVDKDEPLTATDQNVEKALLDSIGRAL